MVINVAIIGDGAVSRQLRDYLAGSGQIQLAGVLGRQGVRGTEGAEFEYLLSAADVFVEAAGLAAVAEFGPRLVGAGKDFLVTSVGAFADPQLCQSVLRAGPGRTFLTSGAIGGLDLIRAAAASGGIDAVHLETRKKPAALIQDWMTAPERIRLGSAEKPTVLFTGSPEAAIERFPASLNVAVALGLAAGNLDKVSITLIADPEADLTQHLIAASGPAGAYEFRIANQPSASQPRSSGLTARALFAALLGLAEPGGQFI